jgi:thioredoxin 1
MATEIKQENFASFISESDKPVLVDFWATWCGPCRMLAPVVEEVAQANEDKLTVGKVNVDDCPDIARQFGIMSIPTLILFKDGQMVDKRIGYMPKGEIEAMVEKAL